MVSRSALPLVLVALLVPFAIVACGGIGNDTRPTTGPQGNVIHLELTDKMVFEPDTFTVSTSSKVTLELRNSGALKHNFTIDATGSFTQVSQDVAPGQTVDVTFTAPSKPGQVTFYCNVPGHREAGMVGTMVVEE